MIIYFSGKLKFLCQFGFIWMTLSLILSAGPRLDAATTTFSFTLDEPCKTSAGVYLTNGTLVRTLWSNVHFYAAGNYSSNWDGLDNNTNPVAPGTYQIRVLQNNVTYVWDGAIGNTSAQMSGPTIHQMYSPMHDMAISGTNAFYCSGYNEGKYDFASFSTTDPQTVLSKWSAYPGVSDTYDRAWYYAAADSNWVYFAATSSMNPTNPLVANFPGFVIANKIGTTQMGGTPVPTFTKGIAITNAVYAYANGVYVGSQPGLSGMAVQLNSNLLAVAVAPDNAIYLLDKRSGAILTNLYVYHPGRMSFSPDGSLWVISGNNVNCYSNLNSTPVEVGTISGLSGPLAVAVSPANDNLILIADGGSSQQIKAFNSAGIPQWTYGLAGGYQTNGPAVTTNKFYLQDEELLDATLLCFAPDGTFWVGDVGNHRVMHFSSSVNNSLNYLEQIMYQPCSYKSYVDQNNPSRVFNQFLEFNVDYTKPLSNGWVLVNNWRANLPSNYLTSDEGLYEITTFTNGRTYAYIPNKNYLFAPGELCELVTNQGLRLTGILPGHIPTSNGATNGWSSLDPSGSVWRIPSDSLNSALWYKSTLSGFDISNNPVWNAESLIAWAPEGSRDPAPRCCSPGNVRGTVSSNNVLISLDQSLNNGFHLGGIKLGTTNWLWEASPAADLNGDGTYEIDNGVSYAGDTLKALDRNIIYGYHGEFFRSEGQAAQHMHFYDDGMFVGQFGEASPGHSAYEGGLPAFAGNSDCCNFITTNGDYYVWENDESSHGPQRWHLVNTRNIRELAGSGALGGSIALTNPPTTFPTGLIGQAGDKSVSISWPPVVNSASYKIYYSLLNGGPFQTNIGETPATNCIITGLTNGQIYYFAVTAISAGLESMPSEQLALTPFDHTQNVLAAGSLAEGGQFTPVINLDVTAPGRGYPAYIGDQHLTGVLGLDDLCNYGYGSLMNKGIGTKGYVLFNWDGTGSNLANVLAPFTVTAGPGWQNISYCEKEFMTNGSLGANCGVSASGVGTINISVTDTNFHFLTVISPAQFNNSRQFTLTLASTNQSSATYSIHDLYGFSHTFQFIFRGNATLSVNATGGAEGIVQGLFFDNVTPGSLMIPAPPYGLHLMGFQIP